MHGFGRVRWLILTPAAAAGMFAGHCLDYWIVSPNTLHRRTLLEMTGHGYLPVGAKLAVLLAISSVVACLASGLAGGGEYRERLRVQSLAPRLALVQSVGFIGLEVLERVAAQATLSTIEHRVLLVGVAAQVLIAILAAFLLTLVHRSAVAASTLFATSLMPRRAPLIIGAPPEPIHVHDRAGEGPRSNRGPPALLQFA